MLPNFNACRKSFEVNLLKIGRDRLYEWTLSLGKHFTNNTMNNDIEIIRKCNVIIE